MNKNLPPLRVAVFAKFTVLLIALMSFSPAQADVSPGSNCMPATLGQAVALGFTTNQNGVANPGPGSFFVVCPLEYDLNETYDQVFVGIIYSSASGGTTNCIVRFTDFLNDVTSALPLVVSSDVAGPASSSVAATNFSVQDTTNSTIVCPLQPGETLNFYALVGI